MPKDDGRLRIRNPDRFQICLAACRTSSSSVRHENTYKDPLAKHCYVPQPLNSQRHRRNFNSLNNNGDNPAVVVTSSSVVMLFTHLFPECHTLYCPLNESHVDLSFYINIISIETMLMFYARLLSLFWDTIVWPLNVYKEDWMPRTSVDLKRHISAYVKSRPGYFVFAYSKTSFLMVFWIGSS